MEKEQKKLLLVAVSAGVFLLLTITVAIIMLTSRTQPTEHFTASVNPPVFTAPPSEPVFTVNNNNANTITNSTNETREKPDTETDNRSSQIVFEPSNGVGIPDERPTATIAPKPTETSEPARQPAVQNTPTTTAAARPSASANQNTARPAPRATGTTRTVQDYWIQTGAFSSMVRAEDAKEKLASKGLTSIIETRVIEGRTLYRVRLGPYTSENEAKHWLDIVKIIDGFDDSQVRQTSRGM
ncbi:MAG: SPOR domain-containing protein [Treponema sp.]|nr:SPOR domain-containing protein [Treponema sp.]